MARVKFKEAGLKKVGSRKQQHVEAGEIIDLPDGLILRYGNQLEVIYGEEAVRPSDEDVDAAIEAATPPKQAAKKKAAKKKD